MTLEEIKDTVKSSPYSMVDFSKHVAVYMGVEWSNKFKERIAKQQYYIPTDTTEAQHD